MTETAETTVADAPAPAPAPEAPPPTPEAKDDADEEAPPCLKCGKDALARSISPPAEVFAKAKMSEEYRVPPPQVELTECLECGTWVRTNGGEPKEAVPWTVDTLTPWEAFYLGQIFDDFVKVHHKASFEKMMGELGKDLVGFLKEKMKEKGLPASAIAETILTNDPAAVLREMEQKERARKERARKERAK